MTDPIQNFAITTVASVADEGATFVVDADVFPNASRGQFDLVVWPPSTTPTVDNAEIVTVTNTTEGTTLTVTRAAQGTTQQDVVAGWQIAQTNTKKLLLSLKDLGLQAYFMADGDQSISDGRFPQVGLFTNVESFFSPTDFAIADVDEFSNCALEAERGISGLVCAISWTFGPSSDATGVVVEQYVNDVFVAATDSFNLQPSNNTTWSWNFEPVDLSPNDLLSFRVSWSGTDTPTILGNRNSWIQMWDAQQVFGQSLLAIIKAAGYDVIFYDTNGSGQRYVNIQAENGIFLGDNGDGSGPGMNFQATNGASITFTLVGGVWELDQDGNGGILQKNNGNGDFQIQNNGNGLFKLINNGTNDFAITAASGTLTISSFSHLLKLFAPNGDGMLLDSSGGISIDGHGNFIQVGFNTDVTLGFFDNNKGASQAAAASITDFASLKSYLQDLGLIGT